MLARLTDTATNLLAWVGGAIVLILTLHVGFGVILRTGFGIDVPMTYEIVTKYYMMVLAFVPVAWVERQGGMVSVELIDMALPETANMLLGRFVSLFSTLVYAALTYATWGAALRNMGTGTYVLVQDFYLLLWPGYFLLPIGFGVTTLVTFLRLIGPYTEKRA
ncbi:MAG: TRAP transporter small permease [Deltaproteobacteria bacterium]